MTTPSVREFRQFREARWLIAAIVFEALGFISLAILGLLLMRSL